MPIPIDSFTLPARTLPRWLGWFSLGLGTPQILSPGRINQLAGVEDSRRHRALMRAVGLREIAAGMGLLSRRNLAGWLWARVLGDAMDMTLLSAALASENTKKRRLGTATVAVAGVTVLDLITALRVSQESSRHPGADPTQGRTSITVSRPLEEVYRYWRDFESLPNFMYHLESVKTAGDKRSRWVAKGPAGKRIEWDAEILEDIPNQLIAWRSISGNVSSSGSVRFARAPGEQGTEVVVQLDYSPPLGAVGGGLAKLFGEEPVQQIKDDLRRFKQVLETGEVVLSEGVPEGTRSQRQLKPRPAQPPSESPAVDNKPGGRAG